MATNGQFSWPSVGSFVAAFGQFFMAANKPVPPVTPVGMGKATRGVELESMGALDEHQIAVWMKQIASVPGVGGRKP